MSNRPPPLPSHPGTPPPLDQEQSRSDWIGLLVALIAMLLLVLLLVAAPKSQLTKGTDGAGTASTEGTEDVASSGKENEAPVSQSGSEGSESVAQMPVTVIPESAMEEEAASEHEADIPGAEEPESDSDDKPTVKDQTPESIMEEPAPPQASDSEPRGAVRSRVRKLNVGDGFMPLVVGKGNPLRVGSEINSIVYVIDKSGSMAGESFGQVSSSLCDAIDALNESQNYAVILFDEQPFPLGRLALAAATTMNKGATKNALRQVYVDGGTAPFAAMKHAIDLEPDAIVLLSDGEFESFDALQITQYNHSKSRMTTIHCVGLQRNIGTLRQLAKDNGNGAYTTAKLLRAP